jgi:hypothetical protein
VGEFLLKIVKKYLWSALFITGYLTYEPKNLYTQAINQKLLIKIPNEKIRNILKILISELSNNY